MVEFGYEFREIKYMALSDFHYLVEITIDFLEKKQELIEKQRI
jgi:hypothetical protein